MRSKKTAPVEPGTSVESLALAITAGAVRLAAATASWLRLVAEFDARGGWQGPGVTSCAHWLSWQCGLGPGAAREHVRVARALRHLPLIEAAFSAGRLSYAKVRALTRVAAPDCEAALLEFAVSATASQAERFCRTWRRIDEQQAEQQDERQAGQERPEPRPGDGVVFEYTTGDDGSFTLRVRGRVEQGVALMAAVDGLAERDARRERAQNTRAAARHDRVRAAGGTVDWQLAERCADDAAVGRARERAAARRLDALTALAEARVQLDRRPGDPPRREVVVHVDAAVLADDAAAGRAHYESGPALTAAHARRLLCEASVVAMLEAGREPLAVGRRKRFATKAQRRALLRRDGGCARPGCPETRTERLHAHHLRHWLVGGRTELANLVLLCDVDHGLAHDLDLTMTRRDGRLVVTTPDGRRVWGAADAAFTAGLAGLTDAPAARAASAGVHPLDTAVGRRPDDGPQTAGTAAHRERARVLRGPAAGRGRARPSRDRGRSGPTGSTGLETRPATAPPGTRPRGGSGGPAGRRPHRAGSGRTRPRPLLTREAARVDRLLSPGGGGHLPDRLQEHHDRMDLQYAVDVLMGNRELLRRLAAEAGTASPGTAGAGTAGAGTA